MTMKIIKGTEGSFRNKTKLHAINYQYNTVGRLVVIVYEITLKYCIYWYGTD